MSNDVTEPREEYTNMLPSVQKNRAAVGGQRVVRAGGTKYLTPLASMMCGTQYDGSGGCQTIYQSTMTTEGEAKYNKYLSNAYFLGATGMTVTGLSGLISAKKPIKNIPGSVSYLDENINGKGQSLRDFSDEAVNEAFTAVWSGILVARPTTPEGSSKLDEEKQNLRPKLLHYKFESIINWDYEVINNVEKLSLLVLKESTTKRDGFKVETVFQYRVLELIDGFYAQSLYDEDGNLIEPQASVIFNGKPSDEIPFYWIIAGTETKAVIDDLVDCNFEHYNIYADYGSKLHYSSFIIYTENGDTQGANNNMVIGNGVKWNGPVEGSFGVLQPDGNADSHRIALQDTETRMSALLASILKPNTSGAESAEAKSLDKVTQNTVSASVAITVSEAITKGLNFASRTMGGAEDAEFLLNTDYDPSLLNAQLLTSMLAARMSGDMSKQTLYENLQRGDIANPDRTFEEEQALISKEGTGMDE